MTGCKKELQIKMSFLLNVSNGSSRPEEFSLKDIEVFVDSEEKNWFKRAHVGKILGIEDIRTSLNGLEKWEMLTKKELVPSRDGTPCRSGPKNQENTIFEYIYQKRSP